MVEAVETMDGWYSLYDFRTIDWTKCKQASEVTRKQALEEFHSLIDTWDKEEENEAGSHCVYHIVGQKADILTMILLPTMNELEAVETALDKTLLAEFLLPCSSHVSVVVLAKYRPKKDGVDPETLPETKAILKSILPKFEHISYYPMSR